MTAFTASTEERTLPNRRSVAAPILACLRPAPSGNPEETARASAS